MDRHLVELVVSLLIAEKLSPRRHTVRVCILGSLYDVGSSPGSTHVVCTAGMLGSVRCPHGFTFFRWIVVNLF